MFEITKFNSYGNRMFGLAEAAMEAKTKGNGKKALELLREVLKVGHSALSIQSSKISERKRLIVAKLIMGTQKVYQRELIAQMPEEDRGLLLSVLKSWTDISVVTIGTPPIEQMIGMFEIAKNRLDKSKETLGILYGGDHVTAPLRNIIQPFLVGQATQEETTKRLDECTAKLRKWLPELFPGVST